MATQQRRMAIDMPVLEGQQLVENILVGGQHTGKVHELGQADDLRMIAERQKVRGQQAGPRCLLRRRRHAGGELDAKVHDRRLGGCKEIADAFDAENVGDLVRVADRGRDAVRQDAAIELGRRDQRGFDVEMGIDEARHGEEPSAVDLAPARIGLVCADDPVAADRDVGGGDAP